MEGRYRKASRRLAFHEFADPLFHFPRGFIGKGKGRDMPCRNAALFDEVGDFLSNYRGFTRASTRQDKARAIDIKHSFFLTRIELIHRIQLRLGEEQETQRSEIVPAWPEYRQVNWWFFKNPCDLDWLIYDRPFVKHKVNN